MTTRTMKAILLAGGIVFAASPLMAHPECEQNGHIGEWVVESIPFLRDGIGYIEEYRVQYCSRCGAELARELGDTKLCEHDGTTSIRDARETMCTSSGYTGDKVCDICGMVLEKGMELDALGHDIGEGVVTRAPTTTEEGVLSFICAHCGEVVYTEPIPKLEPDPEPVKPCYETLDAKDITVPYEAPKAVTIRGVAYDGCDVVGIVELKLAKVNEKKGTSKVSGSFTGLDGKKITLKAVPVEGIDGRSPKTVSLVVKGVGTMTVTIGGTQFAGSLNGKHVQSATVGGNWTGRGATVTVDALRATLPAGTQEQLLPNDEQATVNDGKWSFSKAASVKWAKPKKGAERPEIFDEASQKGLIVDTSKGKTNLSGMKLTNTPKKGTFKGKFTLYALEGTGKSTKLKKYAVNVTGVVVNGVGYGVATCKKPAISWSVTVR